MRFLLHSHFPAGHAYPMQAIAQELVARNHDVIWLTSLDNQARVLATGASFVATKQIARDDEPFMKEGSTGLLDRAYHRLEARLLAQIVDYRAVVDYKPIDVLLVDVLPYGARASYELGEIPVYATLGVIPLYTSSSPLPVSGKGPPTSRYEILILWFSHLWYRWVVIPLYLKPVLDRQRDAAGLKRLPYGEPKEYFDYSPHLHIQASSPALEFSLSPKPRQHRDNTYYVGPLVAPANASIPQLPDWWHEVITHRRVVGVTQGTLAMNPTSLIVPAVKALANDPSLLIVVVSPHAERVATETQHPKNARFATWLPYHILLPQLSLLITNGGYGSITQAISHKVPLLCAGQTEDKKDTAARVVWCGAGIDLKTDNPSPEQVREAARRILEDDRYQQRVRKLGDELNRLGGASRASDLLEELGRKFGSKP